MEDYQRRVVEELDSLKFRTERLASFVDSSIYESLPQAEKYRMARQLRIMNDYCEVLEERIEAF